MVGYNSKKFREKLKLQSSKIKSSSMRDRIAIHFAKGKILEVGCGERPLFKNSVKLDIARIRGCIQADCNKTLPIKPGFDTIIALDVIEHLLETKVFLKECGRILNRNGRLILSTDNVMNIWNRFAMIIGDTREINRYFDGMFEFGTVRYFTPRGLKKILEENDFTVERIIPLGRIRILSLCGGFICITKRFR